MVRPPDDPSPSTASFLSSPSSLSKTDGSPDCISYALDLNTGSPSIITTRAFVLRPDRRAPPPSASRRTSAGISSRVLASIWPPPFGSSVCAWATAPTRGFGSVVASSRTAVSDFAIGVGVGSEGGAEKAFVCGSRGSLFAWTACGCVGGWGWIARGSAVSQRGGKEKAREKKKPCSTSVVWGRRG